MVTLTGRVALLGGVYTVTLEGSRIASVAPSAAQTDVCLGPALFDLQVNGYGGRTCRLAGPHKRDALAFITRLLRQEGIGWWMPTITTAAPHELHTAFAECARALEEDDDTQASIPGLHLEGPFISPVDGPRGAHSAQHVRPPEWDEFLRLQEAAGGRIRLVTLAPELPGAIPFIERCVASGVRVSLGHTDLDRQSLAHAVAAGATLSTHLGNGAHDVLQRHHNYLWYQLACPQLYASFIADGHHLPQECLYAMVRAKGPERCVLVSDCVLLGGMPAGRYRVGQHEVDKLPSGRIVLPGTPNLAGSASNLLECTRTAAHLAGLSHAEVWQMATLNPARVVGLGQRLGVQAGCDATLALYRYVEGDGPPQVEVLQTWVAGRKVFDAAAGPRLLVPHTPADASMPI